MAGTRIHINESNVWSTVLFPSLAKGNDSGDRKMKKVSRLFLFGALVLVLLTAACGAGGGATPTPLSTLPGVQETSTLPGGVDVTQTAVTETATTAATAETATTGLETPTLTLSTTESVSTLATSVGATATGASQTQGIPVTGVDIVLVECQFCVDTLAHALLVLPDTATFAVTMPTTTTTTTDTVKTNCSTIEVNNGKQVVLCSGPEKTPVILNICTDANSCTDFPINLQPCPLAQSSVAVPTKTRGATGAANSATPTPATLSTPTATATP